MDWTSYNPEVDIQAIFQAIRPIVHHGVARPMAAASKKANRYWPDITTCTTVTYTVRRG
jgi:hypothetical protein